MKIKKEKQGEYTKFSADTDYLKFEAEIDNGGHGKYKILNGGYETDSLYNHALHNMIQYAEELEEQYKLFKQFLHKIEKTHKIDKSYFSKICLS